MMTTANQFGNYSKNQAEPSFYGGIYVKLDKECVNPGDTITGKMYLDLVNAYPGDMICLSVKGTEFTKWIDKEARQRQKPDGMMETYYVDVPREGNINIIQQELVVYDWAKGAIIPKGQYTFPFQFQLPNGAPGSFFFRGGTTIAEIKYSIEGFLKPEKETVPRLKHKIVFVVRENPNITAETKEVSITKSLTTWCCCNQGTVSMRTAFEKNTYVPGEEARIITEIDNSKCSLGIPDVVFSLSQSVSIGDGHHTKGFHFPIKSMNLGRIEAGQSCVGQNRKEASIMLPPGQEGKAKDFKEGIPEYNPPPSSVITPSVHGRLIKSDFSLMVYCQTEGCLCCDSAPSNGMPITVVAQAPPPQPELVPPPNWQPQQMPAANLVITITNTPGGGTEIKIQQGTQDPNNQGMIGSPMPPQNMNQPNQYPQQQPQYPQQQSQYPQQQPQYPQQQPQYPQQQPQYPQQQPQYPQQQPQYPQQQPQYPQQYPPQQIQPQPVQIGQPQPYPNQQYPPQQQY